MFRLLIDFFTVILNVSTDQVVYVTGVWGKEDLTIFARLCNLILFGSIGLICLM